MARRSDSTASSTIVAPADTDLSGSAASESRPTPAVGSRARPADTGKSGWWRLRTWRRDVEVLARVRAGLENLPDDDSDVDAAAVNGLAARARTSGKGTASGSAAVTGKVPAGAQRATAAEPDAAATERGTAAASGDGPDPAIAAIRRTFASVAAAGDAAVGYFYAQLFVRD